MSELQHKTGTGFYPGLNTIKGILIITVIISHTVPDGMIAFILYFFHMPVFLAISGFLLKASTFKDGLGSYLKKMFHRIVIPWLIAFVFYLIFSLRDTGFTGLSLTNFIYPYYHLWYIPAYLLGAVLCFLVSKYRIPAFPVLMLTTLITVYWFVVFRESRLPVTEQTLYFLGDKRFYAYLSFFFFGYSLRNGLIRIKLPLLLLAPVLVFSLIAAVAMIYKHSPDISLVLPFILFNCSMILISVDYIGPKEWLQNKFLLYINKQSLGFYLYHPIVIFLIYRLLGDEKKQHVNNLTGLVAGLITIIIVYGFVRLLEKWKITNKYLFGIVKE